MDTPATDSTPAPTKGPLCVDLDGTLVATDTLAESFITLLKTAPWKLFAALAAWMGGRPKLKRFVVRNAPVDPVTLPYRAEVLDEMRRAREDGRQVLLITASDQGTADAIAGHIDLFDEAIGSDGENNLKADRKAEYLVSRFGAGGFQYVGDSPADLPVWKAANEAIMVCPSPSTRRAAERSVATVRVLSERPSKWKAVAKELRPHQWAKNVLLFVPLYFSHEYTDLSLVLAAVVAFLSFSFCASSIYVLNDLIDLPLDRQHRSKRKRPLAAGTLSIPGGVALSVASLALAITLATTLVNPTFVLVLLGYVVLTTAYTFVLKQKMIVDVLTLASLFTYRVFAGSVAVEVSLSPWLLAFSIFFFTSLAFVKRYAELIQIKGDPTQSLKGRNYLPADMPIIAAAGPAAGLLAVLVFALYINSPMMLMYYPRPEALWGICLILMYWIMRVWFLAARDQMHDDPVLFAVKDKISLAAGVLVVLCLLVARYA
ncbi:MAG: UbiA family prenyltransferase [Myxococcales bacterium]|nr:UbiA family prenyltransferase [Myxococcales bacterium]